MIKRFDKPRIFENKSFLGCESYNWRTEDLSQQQLICRYFSQSSFMCLNDYTYLHTVDYSFIIFFVPLLLLCIISRERTLQKCYFVLQFSGLGEGNSAEKLNQFSRLISHVFIIRATSHAYTITRQLAENDLILYPKLTKRAGKGLSSSVIKFSKPLLVYLRRIEPQINLKFAVFGVTLFSPRVIKTGNFKSFTHESSLSVIG